MPQWEGIEDASVNPTFVWLSRPVLPTDDKDASDANAPAPTPNNARWHPLRKCDCVLLNQALEDKKTTQHVEFGRSTANLEKKTLEYNFSNKSSDAMTQELCRAVWFRREELTKDSSSGSAAAGKGTKTTTSSSALNSDKSGMVLHPITNLEDSDKIERLYQSVLEASSSLGKGVASVLNSEVVLSSGESKVVVVKTNNKALKLIQKPHQSSGGWFANSIASTFGKTYDLQRGYGEYSVVGEEEELQLGPLSHVCFVVHGIGEALFQRDSVSLPSLVESVHMTRMQMQAKQLQEWNEECAKCKAAHERALKKQFEQKKAKTNEDESPHELVLPPPPNRVELIPIEWFDQLHNANTEMMKTLRSVSLNSVPALRMIANDVILDVLLYLTPSFCHETLECVTQQITRHFETITRIHEESMTCRGANDIPPLCVSLIGHSLGSVICWDLLALMKQKQQEQAQEQVVKTASSIESTGSKDAASAQSERSANIPSWSSMSSSMLNIISCGGINASLDPNSQGAAKTKTGTYGPSLTAEHFHDLGTIPFIPHSTILLGSPIGIFLTIRRAQLVFESLRRDAIYKATLQQAELQQLDTGEEEPSALQPPAEPPQMAVSPFTLPTQSLFNIFHPNDPVAYRLEPLLLSPDSIQNLERDLPPPAYLIAKKQGGVRLSTRYKQVEQSFRKSYARGNNPWAAILDSTLTVLGADMEDEEDALAVPAAAQTNSPGSSTTSARSASSTALTQSAASTRPKDPKTAFPLNQNRRVDFALQTGVIENEYISAISAHGSYFTNDDFQHFLIRLAATSTPPVTS